MAKIDWDDLSYQERLEEGSRLEKKLKLTEAKFEGMRERCMVAEAKVKGFEGAEKVNITTGGHIEPYGLQQRWICLRPDDKVFIIRAKKGKVR